MISIAVIAIGSRIMKDDGIGVWVAEAIKDNLNNASIDVVIAETDFEYGFDMVIDYNYVIVLDAMVSGKNPGDITVLSLVDAKVEYTSQHDMSLIEMLARGENPSGSLIGIEAKDVGFGFGLSKILQEKFEEICDDVVKEITNIKEDLANA